MLIVRIWNVILTVRQTAPDADTPMFCCLLNSHGSKKRMDLDADVLVIGTGLSESIASA